MTHLLSKAGLASAAITPAMSVLVLALGLAGCEAQCALSTARLSAPTMASAINAETRAPTAVASTFPSDAPAIYATAKVSNAPDDTKVKATFHYLEGGDRQIAADEIETGGTRAVAFTLSPPVNGWPAGQYETRFYLNGKEVLRQPFNVSSAGVTVATSPGSRPLVRAGDTRPATSASADPQKSQPAATRPAPMKRLRDETFGTTLELPSAWTYRVNASKDYVLEGPKGTDTFELSVILQFVTKAANPGSSAVAQAQRLAEQIARAPNGAIKTRETLTMGGQEAPYFVATYTAANAAGVATPFAHTQIVLDHGAYYYLVSYSGPVPIYQKYLGVFQNMVQTFQFTR